MLKNKRNLVLDIFDYAGHKECSLYDSTSDASGQASDVFVTTERNGWKELSFTLPQSMMTENGSEDNFRIQYIKEGYKVRLIDDSETDWYILSESKVTHNNFTKTYKIVAGHVSQLLKHKQLGLEFNDDEGNNVGTAAMLLTTILDGTGWEPGFVDEFLEKDGSVKYRSLKASAKTGAFKLISNMCDLFEAKPIYHGDSKTVDIVPMNPFSEPKDGALPDVLNEDVIELYYGMNVSNVTRKLNEENMITRLYAYGAYGDKTNGYCGIDECTHHVYTLIIGEAVDSGAECQMNLTDANNVNIVRYFIAGKAEDAHKIRTVLWSDLDPASRMYVWDPVNETAYLLYESQQTDTVEAYFTEDTEERKEEANWFSFLMDYHYYRDIGLLTDEMLQAVASYQNEAPALMEFVNQKAAEYAEAMTDLSETIGSVDFCKLDCAIVKPQNGYVQLQLNTEDYANGVVYRTDYDKKEDKQFKWRVANELKANGDPVHDVASVVYIVYEPKNDMPLMFEKAYLKVIDDEDDPHVLTLWLDANKSKYSGQDYRVYLFAQQNVNGYLGAYETADEATSTALESATKMVTVKHPVICSDTEPEHTSALLNGYGWWWKWYEGNENPSELYFCWLDHGDTEWRRVLIRDVNPDGEEGYYWYNWKKSALFRKESGAWVQKKDNTAEKRIAALFGTVYAGCQSRDRYYKGLYQKYTYTATEVLPAGNYAFKNGYGNYWVFTTERDLEAGETLVYDTTQSTVAVNADETEDPIETKAYRFDNIHYHEENLITNSTHENGTLDPETGGERDGTGYRTGFIRAYPNTIYVCTGYGYGDLRLMYYDENRNYLGYADIDGMGYIDVDKNTSPVHTRYVRLLSSVVLEDRTVTLSTIDSGDKIITKEDETYLVLHDLVGSGELKGIVPLTQKLANSADNVYAVLLPALKEAQEQVKTLENNMTSSLGDLYREGYWQKNDYVDGDEQKLYDDALDNLEKLSKPEASYEITYLDLYSSNPDDDYDRAALDLPKIMWPDISTKNAAHLVDPEIGINTWAFVDKVQKCYDKPWETKISINTNLTTISQHSFTDVMTHIAEVASEAKGKMGVYERAGAITGTGSMAAERLEGTINANKLQITGGSSTWYTDDKGNMVFVSADGNSAMTLTGNGFAIANSRNTDGDWNWRT